MKRARSIIHALVIDCLLCGLIVFVLYAKHSSLFEHARYIGDWKRIPLWFPYEIVDFGDMMGVRMNDWRTWSHPIDDSITIYSTDKEAEERAAMQKLNHIQKFAVGNNVVCGLRSLRLSTYGGYLGTCYFLFATNRLEVAHFKIKGDFIEACRRYGIDGDALMSFDDQWARFCKDDVSDNPINILISDIKSGFAWHEWLIIAVLMYILVRQLRRQCRQYMKRTVASLVIVLSLGVTANWGHSTFADVISEVVE